MSKEFRIGLIALVAGGLLYYGFNYLKGTDVFSNTNRFFVQYENTDGLNVGSAIKIQGVQVGRVSEVLFQPESNSIRVEIDLQGNVQLGDSTIAEMTNDGLFGSKAIILKRKTHNRLLEPGEELIPKVDKGLTELIESAQPITDNLQITIKRINDILLDMDGFGEKLSEAMLSMDNTLKQLTNALDENDEKISRTFTNLEGLSVQLKKDLEPLGPMMKNMRAVSDSLKNSEFKATISSTNDLLQNINSTLDSLKSKKGTLGRLMSDDSLYVSLNKTLLDLDKLLIHFNNYPKDFMGPLGRKHEKLEGLKKD